MLINGILYNSDISDKNIVPLEKVDEALLGATLGAHAKTPSEALYLETGSVTMKFLQLKNILKSVGDCLGRGGT